MPNLKVIGKVTVGSGGQAAIEFTNIPATYTDLVVKLSGRTTSNDDQRIEVQFNNSTSNLSQRRLYGEGTNTASDAPAGAIQPIALPENDYTANTFGNFEMYISKYASSNSKAISIDAITENSSQTAYQMMVAGLWSNSSAITSIKLIPMSSGNFTQYSTAYLYGVSDVTTGSKATGGVVYSDSTHYYHVFPYSGTFTPTQSLTADYLVVAGGGGGGTSYGAGGGAGGLRSTVTATGGGGSLESALSLTAQAYTVTVGSGGANGAAGSNSVFSTITSTGGGVGGSGSNAGGAGGSGGGAGGNNGSTGGTRTASPVQGFNGGIGAASGGGGGGGSGAVGGNASSNAGGNGGVGAQILSMAIATQTGINGYYAGGGGGYGQVYFGLGGLGGGGQGAQVNNGVSSTNGVVNTGSGGGGEPSGAGGSGLVIIRYAI